MSKTKGQIEVELETTKNKLQDAETRLGIMTTKLTMAQNLLQTVVAGLTPNRNLQYSGTDLHKAFMNTLDIEEQDA